MRALGIDVGGTTTRAALFRVRGSTLELIERSEVPTDPADGTESILASLDGLKQLDDGEPAIGCGIGVPEYVHGGVIASSAVVQFRSDSDATIAGRLAVAGTAPTIRFESDVRCAALAEWRSIHTAREEGDVEDASLLYISVGTGLSSAFVMSSGEVLSGARGSAISFGEWPAPLSSLPTPEPAANLEGFASGRGIEQRYFAITGRTSTTPRICERAGVDHVATTVLAEAGTAIGAGIRSLFAVLDPATIVVGGGLGSADTVVWAAIQDAVATPMAGRRLPPLRQAALGSRSGEFGAAYVAMAEFSNRG